MADVVSMGEVLVEFVATQPNTPLAHVPGFIKAPGGAPANVAVGLQRLGVSARFVGKVGDDPFGVYLRDSLAQEGVDTRFLRVDPTARTTAVFVAVWDDGRKDLCFYRNPGATCCLRQKRSTSEFSMGRAVSISARSGSSTNRALRRSAARSTSLARAD